MDNFRTLFESFDISQISNLDKFADSLNMYIAYNDKDSVDDLINFKDIEKLFNKAKKLYRIVRGSSKTDYIINQYGITSASTKLTPDIIEEMKEMISQYKSKGDYYIQEISSARGIDVNKLNRDFKGKRRSLIKQYDIPGNQPMSSLFDSLDQLKQQNEFIIFGDYKVDKITAI